MSPNPALQLRPPPPPHPSAALPAGGSVRAPLLSSSPSITSGFTLKLSAEEHSRGERRESVDAQSAEGGQREEDRSTFPPSGFWILFYPQTQEHQAALVLPLEVNYFFSLHAGEFEILCKLWRSVKSEKGRDTEVCAALTVPSGYITQRSARGKREGVHADASPHRKAPRRRFFCFTTYSRWIYSLLQVSFLAKWRNLFQKMRLLVAPVR